jgi:hypothetical protein
MIGRGHRHQLDAAHADPLDPGDFRIERQAHSD